MHDTHAADRRRRDGAIEMLEVHDGNLLDLQVWESVIITKVFDLLKTDSSCFCCDWYSLITAFRRRRKTGVGGIINWIKHAKSSSVIWIYDPNCLRIPAVIPALRRARGSETLFDDANRIPARTFGHRWIARGQHRIDSNDDVLQLLIVFVVAQRNVNLNEWHAVLVYLGSCTCSKRR